MVAEHTSASDGERRGSKQQIPTPYDEREAVAGIKVPQTMDAGFKTAGIRQVFKLPSTFSQSLTKSTADLLLRILRHGYSTSRYR